MEMKDVSRKLGERIRGLRVERGLTQGEFANRTSITQTYASLIERGVKTASLEVLIAISEVLHVSLSELFLDVDHETPKELERLSAATAGQPIGIQRRIFRIIEELLGAVRELRR